MKNALSFLRNGINFLFLLRRQSRGDLKDSNPLRASSILAAPAKIKTPEYLNSGVFILRRLSTSLIMRYRTRCYCYCGYGLDRCGCRCDPDGSSSYQRPG